MKDFVKDRLGELEKLLNELTRLMEQRIEIGQIDVEEFDNDFKNDPFLEEEAEKYHKHFRETILLYKNDRSFYENTIQKSELLLSTTQERIQFLKKDSLNIGGSNNPNNDIIKLVKQGILSIEVPISKSHKGKVVSGYLTEDGYLELEINGTKQKLSLRRAALCAWGCNPPSQWKFWEAPDSN